MWTFALPGLAERREDIAPNIEFELQRFSAKPRRTSVSTKTHANVIWHLPVPGRRSGAATFVN
jgi:sigma54-dependent transcription regulator